MHCLSKSLFLRMQNLLFGIVQCLGINFCRWEKWFGDGGGIGGGCGVAEFFY